MALSELVFGNETEALTFAEQKKFGTKNVKEIAEKMAQVQTLLSAARPQLSHAAVVFELN